MVHSIGIPPGLVKLPGLRLNITDPAATGTITLQALFGQYDTRHDINNPSYVTACIDYYLWTGDLNFLRDNIKRCLTRHALHGNGIRNG